MKRTFYTEAAYFLGIVLICISVALMTRADFGVSMIVAPAYLLHLKVSQYLPFFTFGTAEYTFQAILLVVMVLLVRKFRLAYLFSFVTAVFYGFVLDFCMKLIGMIPLADTFPVRACFFISGILIASCGVAVILHTYISPEVYELFVQEAQPLTKLSVSRFKTLYDCTSCLLGVLMSFLFFGFGHFVGVKAGTIICAMVNGWLIGRITDFLETHFVFRDALPLRKYFKM